LTPKNLQARLKGEGKTPQLTHTDKKRTNKKLGALNGNFKV